MANAGELEPVIVSSNRFLDIEPYTKKLFASDPKRWAQILPWEFPQKTTQSDAEMKIEEEKFLRSAFGDREIRMQGGADGPGNGFRFLKQVWYCAALWNVNERLPAVVGWWFEHNQELIKDESMQEHFFKPDVQPVTFFGSTEIELYGEKFLGWAVKQIQFRLRPGLVGQGLTTAAATPTSQDETAGVKSAASATHDTTVNKPDKTTDHASAPSSGAKLIPTAKPYQALSSPIPTPPAPAQVQQPRSASGDTNPFSEQHLPVRKQRGPFNEKRNSFSSNRPNSRQFQPPGDTRHVSGQSGQSRFNGPGNAQFHHQAGFNKGGPSSGAPPGFTPRNSMPSLPQGQAIPSASTSSPHPFGGPTLHRPYDGPPMQPPPGRSISGYGSATYQPGTLAQQHFAPGNTNSIPDPYRVQEQPFGDRSNFAPDHAFHVNQMFHPNGPQQDFRQKQRRESMSSNGGGKNRGGYRNNGGGSLRGSKGGRGGKNSFGQPYSGTRYVDNQSFDRDSWYEPPPPTRRYSMQRDMQAQLPDWRAQNENSVPRMAIQDARFNSHPLPRNNYAQEERNKNAVFPASTQQDSSVTSHPAQTMTGSKNQNNGQLCTVGCDKNTIRNGCSTANKLSFFGPVGIDFKRFLDAHGIEGISNTSKNIFIKNFEEGTRCYVHFHSVDLARKCLDMLRSQDVLLWNGGRVYAQVAKDHWDPFFYRDRDVERTTDQVSAAVVHEDSRGVGEAHTLVPSVPQPPKPAQLAALPEVPAEEVTSKAADQGMSQLSKDPISGDTASTESSPRKKAKMRREKKQVKALKKAQEEESRKAESGVKVPERKDSMLPDPETHATKEAVGPTVPLDEKTESLEVLPGQDDAQQIPRTTGGGEPPISELPADTQATVTAVHSADTQATEVGVDSLGTQNTEAAVDPAVEHKADGPVSELQKQEKEMPEPEARDDQVEDSFHTAGGSPKQDGDAASTTTEVPTSATPEATPAESSVDPKSTSAATANSPPPAGEEKSDEHESKATTAKGSKKAPIPQVPKTRKVSTALTPADTKAAAVDEGMKGQDTARRTASASTNAAPSTSVTAPKTSALPQDSPNQQSKKAEAKSKGPVQTESLSVFGKKKDRKPKKSKGGSGSMRGRPNPLKELTPVVEREGSRTVSASGASTRNTQHDQEAESTRTESEANTSSDNVESGRTASRRSTGVFGNIGSTIGGLFQRNSGHAAQTTKASGSDIISKASGSEEPKEAAQVLSTIDTSPVTTHTDVEQPTDSAIEAPTTTEVKADNDGPSDGDGEVEQEPTGLGISTESPNTKSKKSKKKKPSKKKKGPETTEAIGGSQDSSQPSSEGSEGSNAVTAASSSSQREQEPDVTGANAPTVTWIIWSSNDDEPQGPQPAQQGRIIEEVTAEEDEPLSPEVVAAKEKLAKLAVAEQAARDKSKSVALLKDGVE